MAAPFSDWHIDREAGEATWNGYRIKWYRQQHGALYWAYGPGGQFLASGWGEKATSFIELCEQHAANRK